MIRRIFSMAGLNACVLLFAMCVHSSSAQGQSHTLSAAQALMGESPALQNNIKRFLQSKHIYNIEDYAQWLSANTEYTPDSNNDRWASPIETLIRQKGDCEDFAFLNAAVLRIFGYEPRILGHGYGKEAHVFSVFLKDGHYFVFDNNTFHETPATKIQDFASFLWREYQSEYFIEITQQGTINVLYEQQAKAN